jgi:hypothetical protein
MNTCLNFRARVLSFDASAASPPARDASPSGVAAANVEPLKRHRASTYGFSESVSIMPAHELRRGVGLHAGGVPSRGLQCLGPTLCIPAHKPLYFSYFDRRHRGVPVAYATYHVREGFGFDESHMTWQPGAPAASPMAPWR